MQEDVAQMAPENMHSRSRSSSLHFKKPFALKILTSLMQADSIPQFPVILTQTAQEVDLSSL